MDEELYLDLGAPVSDTSWVLRYKLAYTAKNRNNVSGQASTLRFGLFSQSHIDGESPKLDKVSFQVNSQGSGANFGIGTYAGNGNDLTSNYVAGSHIVNEGAETFWIEITRDGDSFSTRLFTGEFNSQVGSTNTVSLSSVERLQYILLRAYTQSVGGNGQIGEISEIYICDDTSVWHEDCED